MDDQQAPPGDPVEPEGRGSRLKLLLPLGVVLAVLVVVTVLLAGQGSSKQKLPNDVSSVSSATFDGATLTPLKPAPPIALRNFHGRAVTLSQYRGKVALVTFLYTHCPDVCPLITANLHTALAQLGAKARGVQVIAVSVDPRGDTPKSVAEFLRAHEMTGRMQYLLGSPRRLGRTWQAWNVGSEKDASNPEFVAHTALVYGVSAGGMLTTIYPANFKPAQIVHDVALLAKS